ncbi:ATP-binding protein [Actinomadura chokoriensis]|uniref:ATP-binding protein n=1 Tax=Actinomadura chokoriensis TaxID=454156 RepID=UPI0031F92E71
MKSTPADTAADTAAAADTTVMAESTAVTDSAIDALTGTAALTETVALTETLADAAEPHASRDGDGTARDGMRGWVWALPGGPGCAGHARRVLRDALASLGAPPDAIADAQLMVSELATNAHQHAGEHGPHELWLYGGEGCVREVRCAVFDAFADAALPGYSWTSGDCGRGLSIVRELSGGRWGLRRTLSRLGPPVRGKAVWFTIPGAAVPPR